LEMKILRSSLVAGVVTLVLLAAGAASAGPKTASKVNRELTALHAEQAAYAAQGGGASFVPLNRLLRVVDDRVVVDVVAESDVRALETDLAALGMTNMATFGRVISGQLPIAAIPSLATMSNLKFAQPSYAARRVGLVTSQGDQAMRADVARSTFGATGAGVKVGVLSDSFNCINNGAAADVASGDLPAVVQVIQESPSCALAGTDEGRAMLQIVHDVAPGASLAFATAENGTASFANNILALFAAGAKVIVDDVIYFQEPFFQDGIVAQAVDQVVVSGGAYFSAAGNEARQSYESAFRPGATFADGAFASAVSGPHFFGGTAHNFAPTGPAQHMQPITIPKSASIAISFQWDSPSASVCLTCPGSTNDIDIYLLDHNNQVVAGGVEDNIDGDASEFFSFTNTETTTDFKLMIVYYPTPIAPPPPLPGFVKYVQFGSSSITINQFATASSTIIGHPNAAGAEAVGAASYTQTPRFGVNPPVKEPFSSSGGTLIFFDTAGNRLTPPTVRLKPEITAPDGGDTTFFGRDTDSDGFPNFFGTSAAAPHAGGVAALLFSRQPGLAPLGVYSALEGTTIDMSAPGFDFDTGFGLVQADSAFLCASAHAVSQTRDFNLDCRNDILWRHSSGTLVTWFLNGAGILGVASPGGASTDWTVVGAGDFNGDGNADILWRHSSGAVYIQLLIGATVVGAGFPGSVGNDWTVVGIGDFNGDGKADILWRHTSGALVIWFLDGFNIIGTGSPGAVGNDWTVEGVGDFNRDGKADILWRHSSGVVFIWLLNGANIIGSGSPGAAGLDWTIAGVADFDGDGRSDILWRHSSGLVVMWLIDGTAISSTGSPGAIGLDWTIQKALDFNGDGKADILWRHSSGVVYIWFINGTAITGVAPVGAADSSWSIQ